MFGYFKHQQLRTYALLMGNLFNNLQIESQGKLIKVPLTYGSKEQFYMKINSLTNQQAGEQPELGIETVLPRVNIQLIDVIYDGQAKTSTTNSAHQYKVNGKSTRKQFNSIPYKITYELNIATRYQDHMYQIVEQILPYFQPYFIQEITERREEGVEITHKVPIEVIGISPDEQQAVGQNERRRLEWSIQLSLRGYMYPPTLSNQKVIETVYLDFQQKNSVMQEVIQDDV